MLERFTEKAVNAISEAQRVAKELNSSEVAVEHLLLALVNEARGVSLKLFRMYNITPETMLERVSTFVSKSDNVPYTVPFSLEVKDILKRTLDLASKSGNQNILFEHLFLSVITDKNTTIHEILSSFNFGILPAREVLAKLVQKKIKRLEHPEDEEDNEVKTSFEALYEGEALANILDNAI